MEYTVKGDTANQSQLVKKESTNPFAGDSKWMSTFNDVYSNLGTTYADRQNLHDKGYTEQQSALDNQKNVGLQNLAQTRDEAQRNAYINREKSRVDLPAMMGAQGLSGGANESTISRILRSYQDSMNGANKQYSTDATSVNTSYQNNLANMLANKYKDQASIDSERRTEAFNIVNAMKEQAYQEQMLQLERDRLAAEQAAAAAAAAASSSGSGGGGGKTLITPTPQSKWGNGPSKSSTASQINTHMDYYNQLMKSGKSAAHIR